MKNVNIAIANTAYIMDCLKAYRNIIESGCCNDCKDKKECQYAPPLGELVRYNCPFYKKEATE